MLQPIKGEIQIPAAWITGALFLTLGSGWFAAAESRIGLTLALFAWLFAAILWSAFGVVRHAEHLAEKLGEPYGTLILTLSVTLIEVAFIITAIATSTGSTTVARDAVWSVVEIMLNGTIGLCLLIGGLRHHEQTYNLPGARAFLSVVIPLAVFALVLPSFTVGTPGPILSVPQSVTIAVLILALYVIFLAMQTVRHRNFFQDPVTAQDSSIPAAAHHSDRSVAYHTGALLLTLVPAVFLTEQLGHIVEHTVAAVGAPPPLVGVIVAILVLAPEMMGALQASLRNQLQRAVNISLGSVLATIGLTIPAVLLVGVWKGTPTVLGLDHQQMVLLALTLVVSILTFGGDRTNMLQGAVHIVMFLVFALLVFHP